MILATRRVEIRHFHLFCGMGGGARGFNAGRARVDHVEAEFRCVGGVDSDPAAIRDFERLAGVRGTVLDLFDREQYRAFQGQDPPDGWWEAGPDDLRRAAGGERPHILFGSAPCKGFSGLLSSERAAGHRYQALNRLALRGLWLALEAWADDPPEFFLWENVPRIATRGRSLLDQMVRMLEAYGYAVAETTHDCGELGNLAQSRKRFLLVARHRQKVPPFLYEPARRPLRGVCEVLGAFPLPSDPAAGPMHRMRELQWKTWVRLAFVEAGGDWRSLQKLRVADGYLADFGIAPEAGFYRGSLGVMPWTEPAGTVTAGGRPGQGRFSVADPRPAWSGEFGQLGVTPWDEPANTITSQRSPGQGRFAVADPRAPEAARYFPGVYGVVPWRDVAGTVTGESSPNTGRFAVADPRWKGAGLYGVVPWDAPSGAIAAAASHDNGRFNVADPRGSAIGPFRQTEPDAWQLPAADARLVALIRALDGTWHRPFTTLELAALQGLVDPGQVLELDGRSDSAWRERIGNAVPSPTAAAIASVMGTTLLLAWSGVTFALGSTPVWVRPIAVALSVAQPEGLA